MTKPIDAYRQHSAVCNTVTFSPWVDEKVQPLRPGRTADTPRRRPKRVKPKIYEYDDEGVKTAGILRGEDTRKMAPSRQGPEKSRAQSVLPGVLAATGGGIVLGSPRTRTALLKASMKPMASEGTVPVMERMLRASNYQKDLPLRPVFGEMSSYFKPESRTAFGKWLARKTGWGVGRHIALPPFARPFVVAHELGHATGSPHLRRALPAAGALSSLGGLGLLGHALVTAKKGEDVPISAYAAPLVGALGPAALQAEELRATLRGGKLMRQIGQSTKGLLRASVGQQLATLLGHAPKIAPLAAGAYGIHRYVNRPQVPEPKTAQEKLAIRAVDRTVNTMARPRDDKSVVTATIMGTETSMQRTPALPDPDAPEDGSVRVAGTDMDTFVDAMAKASEFKSDAQRRWMYANEPAMAKEWQEETPKGKDLPEKVARAVGAVMRGVGLLAPDVKKKLEEEAEEWDVQKALQNLGMLKGAAKKKPYRNRVDVIALDKKDRVYSGLYPDGSIGLFGGGLDRGETAVAAGIREFREESGREVENVKRLAISNFEESRLARKGWQAAGKHDRVKRYGGTRSFTVVGDVVPGKKKGLLEPADHIKQVKFRPLEEAVAVQEKAVTTALQGRKGVLRHRLQALKAAQKMRKVAEEFDTPLLPTAMGGVLGAAGGHIFPTAPAKLLRETAGKMVESPAQRGLLDKALRRNAWRVAKGTGAGLLGGALLHGLLKDSPDVY